jgi:hypothetical protein
MSYVRKIFKDKNVSSRSIRDYATSRKVIGSRPDEVNEFVFQFT